MWPRHPSSHCKTMLVNVEISNERLETLQTDSLPFVRLGTIYGLSAPALIMA
jgi:hypothetical protein